MKRIKNLLIMVVVIALSLWLFFKIRSLPSVSDLFTPKKVVIENTPVVVKQVQALAQLVTVSMYEELVADSTATVNRTMQIPLLPDITLSSEAKRLVIIGKVTAQVGIDMQQMSNLDITGTKDSIHIVLPAAQVLDAIINPSGTSVFIEEGDWSNDAIVKLKQKIQYLAVADAQSRGLLLQSENKAREILTSFFTAAGYQKVVIQFSNGQRRMS